MKLKREILPIWFSAIAMTIFVACGQRNSNKNIEQAGNVNSQVLSIDTLSTFPPEIDGCSCYFSNDSTEFKKAEYIYMNDFAQISFLKINGVLTKFTQTDYKKVSKTTTIAKAKSDLYEITVEVKDGKQNGYETSFKSGTIRLTDKNGKTITKTFYGECGC